MHIIDELRRSGIDFKNFDPEVYPSPENALSNLRKILKEGKFDLFMTGYGHTYITKDILSEIRSMGIPTLLFCSDNLLIPYEHLPICSHFDLVWLTSVETEYLFKRRGAQTIFLPYAANPNIYVGATTAPISRALFIGNLYGSRANIINALASSGVDIDLYGGDLGKVGKPAGSGNFFKIGAQLKGAANLIRFPVGRKVLLGALKQKILGAGGVLNSPFVHHYPGLSFHNMYEAYARYSLSLTSTAARNTGVLQKPVNVINLRSFEVPMSGGVQFCAYSNELAQYFKEDSEIIFYRSQEELIEKARYYTSDLALAEIDSIRINARKRALSDHTWTNRFNKVFSRLGISNLVASR